MAANDKSTGATLEALAALIREVSVDSAARSQNPEESKRATEEFSKAREIALRRVDRRDYSRGELTEYLVRKRELDPGIVSQILDRFEEVGIVDDARFARNWAQARLRTRKLSRRAIERELRVRGVRAEFIDAALDPISGDQERQAALQLCRAKAAHLPAVDRQVAIRRLAGQLARRGYGSSVAMSVVLQVLDEQADETDPEAS